MGSILNVMVDKPVPWREFLAGCERGLAEVLSLPGPPTLAAGTLKDGRHERTVFHDSINEETMYLLQVEEIEDAACSVLLFEGVNCGPGELVAYVETSQSYEGTGLAMAAAAALSLARLVVGEILDTELWWTKDEHSSPDDFSECIRVRTPGSLFEKQSAELLSRLNLGARGEDRR